MSGLKAITPSLLRNWSPGDRQILFNLLDKAEQQEKLLFAWWDSVSNALYYSVANDWSSEIYPEALSWERFLNYEDVYGNLNQST